VIFPVTDSLLKQRIRQEILEAYLADTAKARVLQPDGSYPRANTLLSQRRKSGPLVSFNAQEFLIALAEGKRTLDAIPRRMERRRSVRLREEVEHT
jgi:polyphosphate kinase